MKALPHYIRRAGRAGLIAIVSMVAWKVGAQSVGTPTQDAGEALFHRQTNIVANTLVAIENLTTRIENGVAEAERRGLSFKKSCLEENLRGAMANRAAARALRSHWDVARDNPEYAERTVSRMLRLQVYAAVLEEDARGCKDVSTASQAVADKPQDLAPLTNIVSTPMLPSTDRPPLASPF